MAVDKLVDSAVLDAQLTQIANAIRAKGGTSESLEYPDDFVDAIDAIETNPELQNKSVTPTESAQQVTADAGYDGLDTVSVGAISSTYIGSGITRKASATYNTSATNQTISADQYLDGAQIIKGVTTANISAGNIKAGVTIKVGDDEDDDRIAGVLGTFTSDGTAAAGDILSGKIAYVNGNKITGNIVSKSSSDMTVSGGTVTVPAGYYASAQSKSVSNGTITNNTSGGTSSGTINRGSQIKIGAGYYSSDAYYTAQSNSGTLTVSASGETNCDGYTKVSVGAGSFTNNTSGGTSAGTINRGKQLKIAKGYYNSDTYYTAQSNSGTKTISASGTTSVDGYANASVAAGSATTPATTVTVAPSISIDSAGKITASNSGTKSVTPTVSAGWVASGTAGTITVNGSNTSQMTTKGATTFNVSTSDQTIASGTYLTGTQTFRKVTTSNISAGNIKKGVTIQVGDSGSATRIANVTGTAIVATIETSSYCPLCFADGNHLASINIKYNGSTNSWNISSAETSKSFYIRVPFPVTIVAYKSSTASTETINFVPGTTYTFKSKSRANTVGFTYNNVEYGAFTWSAT